MFESIEMGIGTWQWGDRFVWGYGQSYGDSEVRAAFEACLAAGLTFFDTAEVYGSGRSERLLGQSIRRAGQPAVVATKFMPFPWRLRRASLLRALRGSLRRLGSDRVDLYQIHWPVPPVPIARWMEAMAEAVEAGLAGAAGVSNFSPEQTRRAHDALARRGLALASNQVEYSLLDRRIERNGLMALCRALGVRVIAYSPIAKGLLTGKYDAGHLPPGLRRRVGRAYLERIQPLVRRLREIGEEHGGKTPAQVALNWTICKGTLPIPGVKTAQQAAQNAGALGWRLAAAEVAALDELSDWVSGQPAK